LTAFAPVDDADLDAALAVAGWSFGTPPERMLFPRAVHASPGGRLVAGREDGEIVATGGGLSFGATGWVGFITVVAAARRRGLGTAVTADLCRWLEARGARTVLLLATEAGAGVYRRLGFVADGWYESWVGTLPGPAAAPPVLGPGERTAIAELDAAATGEARDPILDRADAGWVLPGRGYRLAPPWPRTPIIAADPAAGAELLDAAGGLVQVDVPEENTAARAALAARGLRSGAWHLRMRRGPAVARRPEQVWGSVSLFCG
jgi:GNAT superfamily N-acetyltransferase